MPSMHTCMPRHAYIPSRSHVSSSSYSRQAWLAHPRTTWSCPATWTCPAMSPTSSICRRACQVMIQRLPPVVMKNQQASGAGRPPAPSGQPMPSTSRKLWVSPTCHRGSANICSASRHPRVRSMITFMEIYSPPRVMPWIHKQGLR